MQKFLYGVKGTILFYAFGILILLSCATPQNPLQNRNLVNATITDLTPQSMMIAGDSVSMQLKVDLANFIDSVKLYFGDDSSLVISAVNSPEIFTKDISHSYTAPGTYSVYATIFENDGSRKQIDSITLVIKTYIHYYSNSSSGGTVPVDSNLYAKGQKVTVKGNTGNLVKNGYVLSGWNTTPDGFGTSYAVGSDFTIGDTNDLYAQWSQLLGTSKSLTVFSFTTPAATGIINEAAKTIAVTVPYGTNVSLLVATFTTSGASVAAGSTAQVSGTTANDFTNPVIYTVRAADGSTQNYVVTVTIALNPAKSLSTFSFSSLSATGTINQSTHTVSVAVPYGTNVMALIASFTTTGASVKIGPTVQVSGSNANNFTNPVVYTVTAADGSTQDYVVTVTIALNPAKAFTSFSFASLSATGTIDTNAHTIAVTVPYGTNVTALVATFTTTGASVKVGSALQVSGTTPNNFVSPVTYTVTAADGTTQNYTVTVTVATTVTDVDGNIYHTVTIGTQVWLVENLKTTRYNDGTPITLDTNSSTWGSLTSGAYCWYNNDSATNKPKYGALYNWYAVNTGNLAPAGWHIPTDSEWEVLDTLLGGDAVAGGPLKDTGSTWAFPNVGATNTSGFTALPGGLRMDNGLYFNSVKAGFWWSAISDGVYALYCTMNSTSTTVGHGGGSDYSQGLSVRCVRNY